MMKLCSKCLSFLTNDCDGNFDEYYPMCFEDCHNPFPGTHHDQSLDHELYDLWRFKNV